MHSFIDFLIKIVLAIILSGLIGLDREVKGRPAGFRTYMLVCLGATIIVTASQYALSGPDAVSRVLSGVITGIGFLGAGTIIRSVTVHKHETIIKGLTTAAGIWVAAGLGIVIAYGLYFHAVITTAAIMMILQAGKQFEKKLIVASKNLEKKSNKK